MKNTISIFVAFALIMTQLMLHSACKKNNDLPDDEQELITTVLLQYENFATPGVVQTYAFRDIDGIGGNNPTIDTIRLDANSIYNLSLSVLDESKNPASNITTEIEEKKEDHQFFYEFGTASGISAVYQDTDSNGLPIGLQMQCMTNNPTATTLLLTLKHQVGIKNNNIATGETDIAISFPVVVQ